MVELSGGDRLAAYLADLSEKVASASTLEVGFMGEARYPDGPLVAMVAAIQEFGAPSRNIPPRPFFRDMIAAKSDEWGPSLATVLVQTDYDAARSLGTLGEGIKGQLQNSIATFSGVPLKPATIARKGSDKQLVDTGLMLKSVTAKVE